MDIRAEVWSPLQNVTAWLGAWVHGWESIDDTLDAVHGLLGARQYYNGGPLIDLLSGIRSVTDVEDAASGGGEPFPRLILSGPGSPPALPAGSAAAAATSSAAGALVLPGSISHILVPTEIDGDTHWQWFSEDTSLPAPAWLGPGEADQLLVHAVNEAATLIESLGYRPTSLENPRLTVGKLSDFYDTPGLPGSLSPRSAKLFARADRVAAIIEATTEKMGDHSLDHHLFKLWHHIRTARMAGITHAMAEYGRWE